MRALRRLSSFWVSWSVEPLEDLRLEFELLGQLSHYLAGDTPCRSFSRTSSRTRMLSSSASRKSARADRLGFTNLQVLVDEKGGEALATRIVRCGSCPGTRW